jgi:hypothetical protein
MQAELWLLGVAGCPVPDEHDIRSLELTEGDAIGPFRIAVRGSKEVLFDTAMSTFTWLGCQSVEGEQGPELELRLGSIVSGAGYKGVPLHTVLFYAAAVPLHALYSRVLLQAAAKQLASDGIV